MINETFADETIKFVDDLKKRNSFKYAFFKNVRSSNIKFIEINFFSSYFEKCSIENCTFNLTDIYEAEWENCVFKSCQFFKCDLCRIAAT